MNTLEREQVASAVVSFFVKGERFASDLGAITLVGNQSGAPSFVVVVERHDGGFEAFTASLEIARLP